MSLHPSTAVFLYHMQYSNSNASWHNQVLVFGRKWPMESITGTLGPMLRTYEST